MLSFAPGEPLPIVLEADKDKPKDKQRVFLTTALSWREQKELQKKLDEILKVEDDAEQISIAMDDICDRLESVNGSEEFELETLISKREFWELYVAMINNLTHVEKKS